MIADGKTIEVKCQFCDKAYYFTVEELRKLLGSLDCKKSLSGEKAVGGQERVDEKQSETESGS